MARLEESSALEPSKKMFSWIKVWTWKGERRSVSFWCAEASERRSFTSTSIVLVDKGLTSEQCRVCFVDI